MGVAVEEAGVESTSAQVVGVVGVLASDHVDDAAVFDHHVAV